MHDLDPPAAEADVIARRVREEIARRRISRQALADSLFSLDEEVSGDAIDLYVHRLRKKLEASSATIITLRGVGFLLRTREEA